MNPFGADWDGPTFSLFGFTHLAMLGLIVTLNFWLARDKGKPEASRLRTRRILASILLVNELAYHAWVFSTGRWTLATMLPLHLCSVLVWMSVWSIPRPNQTTYEIAWFAGLAGASQALLTPDLSLYGFGHFRFFQTFISHGILVTAPIYLTVVEGMRPRRGSVWRVLGYLSAYAFLVFWINRALGSNYLFINRKPDTASLLDLLPAWPGYLVVLVGIAVLVFSLLSVPFWVEGLRRSVPGASQASADS